MIRVELGLVQVSWEVLHQMLFGEVDLRLKVEGTSLLWHVLREQSLETLGIRMRLRLSLPP